jgi:capsular exopolysaccharide synthesis family protein
MDELTNLVPRGRWRGDELEIVPAQGPEFLPLDMFSPQPHLRDYLKILQKHKWLMLSFLLTVVTIVTIATFRMQPVYVASARTEIDRESTNILPFQEMSAYDVYVDMDNYIETQAKILQSETLALKTIHSLGLADLPEFGGPQSRTAPAMPADASFANQRRPPALSAFVGRLNVKRVPNSRLLDVTFESGDPQLAARVLNAHLDNFIEQNFQSKYEATMQASKWLASQLTELRIKVEKAEDTRLAYEREHQIWSIDEKQTITTQKLADLNKELTEAQTELLRRDAMYQLVRSGNYDALPAIRDSEMVRSLTQKRAELGALYADALNQFGPNYPKVVRLAAQIKEVEDLLTRERANAVNRIEAEYQAARQRELLVRRALEHQKAEVDAMAEKMVQYSILKRDAEANKQLYEGLLQKLKEAGISAGLRSSNIRVVDPAMIPTAPARPQKMRNILLALVVGLMGGVGLALLREYLDNTVKSPADVEMLSRLPSLTVVPVFATMNGRGRASKLIKSASGDGTDNRVELASHHMPQSQISESFRSLRTSLLLSQADRPPQVILVTSALPREGKTTTAVNLAVTLAQLGDRTLVVDADMRRPGVSRALSLPDGQHAGLSSYLAGVSSLELVTVPHPLITNLAAITTGPIPPNPADLLSSDRLGQALAALRQEYKFIVIDSPPIVAATDPVILSVLVDGVLLVVRSGETPKEAFTRARDLLFGVKCRVLGVVINAVDAGSPDYYYTYRYYPYS